MEDFSFILSKIMSVFTTQSCDLTLAERIEFRREQQASGISFARLPAITRYFTRY